MASTNTPNMGLIVPTAGSEAGPQYALDINTSMTLIDAHDHSSGRGTQVTPAGLNINTALTFNNNPATSLSYLSLQNNGSATSTIQAISTAPASSVNELWYTDNNGVKTQITSNGVVNATATSIPGESYNAGTFVWVQGNGSTTPANFDIGSIIIRPNTAGTTNGITLSPPGSIASAYTLVLPTIPGSTSFLTIDNAGNILGSIATLGALTTSNLSASAGITGGQIANTTITAGNIANATITSTQIASATVAGSNLASMTSAQDGSSHSGTLTSTISSSITSFTPNIGRPVFVMLTGSLSLSSNTIITFTVNSGLTTVWTYQVPLGVSGTGGVYPLSIFNTTFIAPNNGGTGHTLQAVLTFNSGQTPTITSFQLHAVWEP